MKKIFSLLIATALFVTMSTTVFANNTPETKPEPVHDIDIELINPENIQDDWIGKAIVILCKEIVNSSSYDSNNTISIVISSSQPATQEDLDILHPAQATAEDDHDDGVEPYPATCPGTAGHEYSTYDIRSHALWGSVCDSSTVTEYSCIYCPYSYVEDPFYQGSHAIGTNGCPIKSA